MDGVGAASSILAVVDLSAKIALLLFRYSQDVKNAKAEIDRLQAELKRLKTTLDGLSRLIDRPDAKGLQTLHQLREGIDGCSKQLEDLQAKLKNKMGSKNTGFMRRFGIRALKWPFESHEVDVIITTLEKHRGTLAVALAIDHAEQTLDLSQSIILSKLPVATGAAFDSHAEEHYAQCHPETRVALLQDILDWAEDPRGQCIFWLNGMAGTGKSTISRTVAQSFAEKGVLGASFFFKRGEQNRGNADQLFTTISSQLVIKEPSLAPSIEAVIKADPTIVSKSLREQFIELVVKPLDAMKPYEIKPDAMNPALPEVRTLVFVIDALDECDNDDDIRTIIHLLTRAEGLTSVRLRAFLTSRPEVPIRMGFQKIHGNFQDLVLHDIPESIIKHDISAFLDSELATVRINHNSLSPNEPLPSEWPSQEVIQQLAQMATPLFIFAATVCRFIKDPAWSDPKGQLAKALEYASIDSNHEMDSLDATYRPVLDQLVAKSQTAQMSIVNEFRTIVGSIILLTEPLSASSLSLVLNIPRSNVDRMLRTLHSVLSVPVSPEAPIRMLHLSFRDFLINPEKSETNQFWIDERKSHAKLASCCIELLSSHVNLKEDVCDLKAPGAARADLPAAVVSLKLSAAVQYACQNWVYHAVESGDTLTDSGQIYRFFKYHFLHWLEALSLLGKISESVAMIRSLQSLPATSESNISAFLSDAIPFILTFRAVIDIAPLQIYSSALMFAPKRSKIRAMFEQKIPRWITRLPPIEMEWGNWLFTLEGHDSIVTGIAFSPDHKSIASCSKDETVRIWDATTGEEKHRLRGHRDEVSDVIWSPDGKTVASCSVDNTIRFWNPDIGETKQVFECVFGPPSKISFSQDSKTLASLSWTGIVETENQSADEDEVSDDDGVSNEDKALNEDGAYEEAQTSREDQSEDAQSFETDRYYDEDHRLDFKIRLWSTSTGMEKQVLGHTDRIYDVAWAPESNLLASVSRDKTIRLWDVSTGNEILRETVSKSSGQAIAFAPDGKIIAKFTPERLTVELLDTETLKVRQEFYVGSICHPIVFSVDGKMMGFQTTLEQIRVVNITLDGDQENVEYRDEPSHGVMSTPQLWNPASGKATWRARPNFMLWGYAFSPDGSEVASILSDPTATVQFWDVATGEKEKEVWDFDLEGGVGIVWFPDGKSIATVSSKVQIWDRASGKIKQTLHSLEGDNHFGAVALKSDGKVLASTTDDELWVWDTTTGEMTFKMTGLGTDVLSLEFSPDGNYIALGYGPKYSPIIGSKFGPKVLVLDLTKMSVSPFHWVRAEFSTVSFSKDGRYLKTNGGDLLDLNSECFSPEKGLSLRSVRDGIFEADAHLDLDDCPCHHCMGSFDQTGLLLNKDWVYKDGHKILWIPPGYRYKTAVEFNDTIALGHGEAREISFIQFDFSVLS
ncbi:Peptidase S9A/B/C, oligopeptidase, N-terminal beta-propeller [Penicillium italicum]|uniref:Peptidase S9A/B/C, oligopeptidase, N-terminal beta-propeller n=1 Tax=Penicillium italicum TaxID=40296 RepID=A0A0A2KY45_PENIT|nr:Peptidase S9A/B/C, oligopeptidase, N-terminal beta-propeller [Penicillium italicum]